MPKGDSGTTPLTTRFPNDLLMEIGLIARVEGTNASEVVRAGMYRYLAMLRSDPEFQDRLRRRLDEDRKIYERYGPEGGG
jgi:hypothetical protein